MSNYSRRRILSLLTAGVLEISRGAARAAAKEMRLDEVLARDPLRPQFHFLPPANWMNDPCGPIFAGDTYHLFYQYNPGAPVWGDMHWGHATSPDLIHWRHLPVALAPRPDGPDRGGVFTGSIVMKGDTPIAIYTGWPDQVQCTATSDGGLRRWKQNPNPVIASRPPGLDLVGFRDPHVWREGSGWKMALGAGVKDQGGAVLLYASSDLERWEYQGFLYGPIPRLAGGDTCECPDFFQLGRKHVLLYSIAGASHYVVGMYDDGRFYPEVSGRLDNGCFYAAKTMQDSDGGRVLWGWIPEMRGRDEQIAAGWAGVMSLPRTLTLNQSGRLQVSPLQGLSALEGERPEGYANAMNWTTSGPAARIRVRLNGPGELAYGGADAFVRIAYDPARRGAELSCNGLSAPLAAANGLELDIFVDASVVEIFTTTDSCLTARSYGGATGNFTIRSEYGSPGWQIIACEMKPISSDRLTTVP